MKHGKLVDAYKKLQTAKSEAQKEFAERLKEKAVLRCFDPMFGVRIALSEPDIDNLLAEMESERE